MKKIGSVVHLTNVHPSLDANILLKYLLPVVDSVVVGYFQNNEVCRKNYNVHSHNCKPSAGGNKIYFSGGP